MNSSPTDTIAAVATGPHGSLSIVRISGPKSLEICDRVVSCSGLPPSRRPSHTIVHGRVLDERNNPVDSILLLIMRAPQSYTGEDVAELHGHGGPAVTRNIFQACLRAGCRVAEPGEFTRRAFLNGKMDLLQAEAVQDLIRAETDRSAAAAVEQLEGRLSSQVDSVRDGLIRCLAEIEPMLDFPDEEMPPIRWEQIRSGLSKTREEIGNLLAGWREGRVLREGAKVVIQGPPNVGKSSLFNSLLGQDRAIVSEKPGTTRDTIEESIILDGYPIRLIDTAGLRETDCEIEKEGVQRSINHGYKADLIVYVIDINCFEMMTGHISGPDSRTIFVLNKADLWVEKRDDIRIPWADQRLVVRASARTGDGLDRLRQMIIQNIIGTTRGEPNTLISGRHRNLLEQTAERIDSCQMLIRDKSEFQLVPTATELNAALHHLDEITGKYFQDELLDRIFSTFCVGK